jgi:GTPase
MRRRLENRLRALQLVRSHMSIEDRRAETREKIQLGGLVANAGLAQAPKALILGILLQGAKDASDTAQRERLASLGHRVLVGPE